MRSAGLGSIIAITLLSGSGALGQTQSAPEPTPSKQASPKLSEQLKKNLQAFDPKAGVSADKRQQSYAKLLEAQRNISRMFAQRTQVGVNFYADQARSALISALQQDPGLSEGYVALAELSVLMTGDLDEAAALCSLATGLNKDSIGGHKLLARILTRQSGLRGLAIEPVTAEKAIAEWKEVTRLDPRNAEAWSLLSEFYERTNRSSEAIEALKRWMSSASPVDPGWFRQIVGGRPEELMPEQAPGRLASALAKAGRTKEAFDLLAQQLSDDPDSSDTMALIQEIVETAKPETIAASIEPLRQIVISHPGSLNLLAFFASIDARIGNVDEAVSMLNSAISRIGPKDRPAIANLQLSVGDIYFGKERFADAASAYEKALSLRGLDGAQSLDPDEREFAMSAFDKLINAYKRLNRVDDARTVITRARKLFGQNDLFADRELISLYRETGDRAKALAALQEVRSRNPEDVTLLRLEATLRMENGQVDAGVDLIKQRIASGRTSSTTGVGGAKPAVPRLDDDFSNYIFISQLYNDAGRGTEAASAADQAYQVAGNDDRRQIARLMSASAKQTAGNFEDAESILLDILERSPGNPIALNNLGYFLVERGDRLPEALELIQKAVSIDPTNPSYLDSLGWTYFKMGRLDEALLNLEKAARLDETSATIHEHLGDVYRKKGNVQQARSAWQRASVFSMPTDTARLKEKLDNLK
jgi:tetratricopeptide (TPR) repeat protein